MWTDAGDRGLWRHGDFLKLWAGQTISQVGSLVGGFALSLVAIVTLEATPGQVAIINACRLLPGLLFGLFAGVGVDRLPRRPLLIVADLGRAVVLASVPLAAVLGRLTIGHLYAVTLLVSVLTLGFDVAYRAYLPSLLRPEELMEGNSKLQATSAIAEASGFGLAGLLVQALTAPVAVLVDAVSFLASVLSLALIRTRESAAVPDPERGVWRELRQGLHVVGSSPILRALMGATGTFHASQAIIGVVIMLYFIRGLHLQAALMGPLFALGGISSFGGAVLAERLTRRWGIGRTLAGALVVSGAAVLFIPLAGGPLPLVVALLAAQQLCGDGAWTLYEIDEVSLLQTSVPERQLGRVNATACCVQWGSQLAGLALGGLLGGMIGLRATLVVGALGIMAAALWLGRSPAWALREPRVEAAEPPEMVRGR